MVECPGPCEHGECNAAGVCVCHAGWIGHADLYTQDLQPWGGPVLSCPSHLQTLRLMWTLPLPGFFVLLLLSLVCAAEQWDLASQLQRQQRLRWRLQHRPLPFFLVLVAIIAPSGIALCQIKLSSPDLRESIGFTRAVSAAYFVIRFVRPINLALHFSNEADMALGVRAFDAESQHDLLVRRSSSVAIFTAVGLAALSAVFPAISASVSPVADPGVAEASCRLYFGSSLATYALISGWSLLIAQRMAATMDAIIAERDALARRLGDAEMQSSVDGLRATRRRTVRGVVVFGLNAALEVGACAAFLWIRKLWAYASYLLAFQAIAVSLLAVQISLVYLRWRPPALRVRVRECYVAARRACLRLCCPGSARQGDPYASANSVRKTLLI